MSKKKLTGKVVSCKPQKTAIVEVLRLTHHPRYQKRLVLRRKYAVQDDFGVKVGDQVEIEECRPISKTKRFRVMGVIGDR